MTKKRSPQRGRRLTSDRVRAGNALFASVRDELPADHPDVAATVADLASSRPWYAERFAKSGDPTTWNDWARLAGKVKGAARVLYRSWLADPAAFFSATHPEAA